MLLHTSTRAGCGQKSGKLIPDFKHTLSSL